MEKKEINLEDKCLIHIPIFTGFYKETFSGKYKVSPSSYHKLIDKNLCKECEGSKKVWKEFKKQKNKNLNSR